MNNKQMIFIGLFFLVVSGFVIFISAKIGEEDISKKNYFSDTNKSSEEIEENKEPSNPDKEQITDPKENESPSNSGKEEQTEPTPTNPGKEQTTPPVKDVELNIAKQVKATTSRIEITKGETKKFNLIVSGSAGLVEVKPKNSNIIKVSTSSTDCNGLKCFFDSLTGNNHSIEYTVSGTVAGETAIDIEIIDLVTLEGNQVTGINSINVLVK